MKLNKKNLISNVIARINLDEKADSIFMKKLTLLFSNPYVQEILLLILIGYSIFTWVFVEHILLVPSIEGILIAIGLVSVVIVWFFLLFVNREGDWFSHLFFCWKK